MICGAALAIAGGLWGPRCTRVSKQARVEALFSTKWTHLSLRAGKGGDAVLA